MLVYVFALFVADIGNSTAGKVRLVYQVAASICSQTWSTVELHSPRSRAKSLIGAMQLDGNHCRLACLSAT